MSFRSSFSHFCNPYLPIDVSHSNEWKYLVDVHADFFRHFINLRTSCLWYVRWKQVIYLFIEDLNVRDSDQKLTVNFLKITFLQLLLLPHRCKQKLILEIMGEYQVTSLLSQTLYRISQHQYDRSKRRSLRFKTSLSYLQLCPFSIDFQIICSTLCDS